MTGRVRATAGECRVFHIAIALVLEHGETECRRISHRDVYACIDMQRVEEVMIFVAEQIEPELDLEEIEESSTRAPAVQP